MGDGRRCTYCVCVVGYFLGIVLMEWMEEGILVDTQTCTYIGNV